MVGDGEFGAIQKRDADLYVVADLIAETDAIDRSLQNVGQDCCKEKPYGSQVFFHALI
jgi:hypothetical protein